MDYDHVRALGPLGLASRFRRLAERLAAENRRVHRAAARDFEPRWFPLFSLLLDAGGVTVGDAARALDVTHVAVSRLASQMAAAGLVTKAADPGDRRATRLTLTPEGVAMATRLKPAWDRLSQRWDGLIRSTGQDVLAVLDALDREVLDTG